MCSCLRAVGPALEQAGNQVLISVATEIAYDHFQVMSFIVHPKILINMQSADSKRYNNT